MRPSEWANAAPVFNRTHIAPSPREMRRYFVEFHVRIEFDGHVRSSSSNSNTLSHDEQLTDADGVPAGVLLRSSIMHKSTERNGAVVLNRPFAGGLGHAD